MSKHVKAARSGQILRPTLVLLLGFTLLTGLAYPLAVTGIAGAAFPEAAAGSPIVRADGTIVGSRLVGQAFVGDGYFWPRPSDAGDGYDGRDSSGSNLGPTSRELMERIEERIATLRASGIEGPIPVDLVTGSGSGLDPHLSHASAILQVPRVAASRGLPEAQVRRIVEAHVEPPALGFLGPAKVNVLMLNLALDAHDATR